MHYNEFWIILQRIIGNYFTLFVVKPEVLIQEIVGLMLFALSHSVLNFTVQNDVHFFPQMCRAFILTDYLTVKTPESS